MKVRDMMTETPACCTAETSLKEVAQLMRDNDCGAIPVVESTESMKLVGIVTDRDITCRAVAEGKNLFNLKASDCMSKSVVTVTPDSSIEECCSKMEESLVRRVPVVERNGTCCGIVAQADVAHHSSENATGHVVREVSRPNGPLSQVAY